VLSGHPELLNKFQSILSFGENRTGFMLENEFDDIQDVLNDLMTELKSNGTLLFTCTENDSEYVSLKIVAYLNLVQLI
jgi:NAD kinase